MLTILILLSFYKHLKTMKNHILNFAGGSVLGFITLEAQTPIPGLDDALKAVITIVAGIVGSVITHFLNKWLFKKNNSNTPKPF
jgi:putative effector of murein hydrolase